MVAHPRRIALLTVATLLVGFVWAPASVLDPITALLEGDGPPATPERPPCTEDQTPRSAFACLFEGMGDSGSATWQEPNGTEQAAWYGLVASALTGTCAPSDLHGVHTRILPTDRGDVCWIMDGLDSDGDGIWDRGWGAAAVRLNDTGDLHLSSPHMRWDTDTGWQNLEVFLGTDARSAAFSGTHRYSNPGPQGISCKAACLHEDSTGGSADESDMALQRASMFHQTAMAAADRDGSAAVFLQFHGMADRQCGDVDGFFTEASHDLPAALAPARLLRDAIQDMLSPEAGWVWTVGGEHTQQTDPRYCNLSGGINVQAQDVQPRGAAFIHLEQKGTALDPAHHADWAAAVRASGLDQPRAEREVLPHCQAALDAKGAFDCLRRHFGQKAQDDYQTPTAAEYAGWRQTVANMMAGECRRDPALPAVIDVAQLDGVCILLDLHDADNDYHIDRGWGMVAVRMGTSSHLHLQVPQPLFVTNALESAIHIFVNTDARSFSTGGAHPDSNTDGTSNTNTRTDTPLYAATQATLDADGAAAIVWHPRGMYDVACTTGAWLDGYLAEGLPSQNTSVGPVAARLGEVARPLFSHSEVGLVLAQPDQDEHDCTLTGDDNISGKLVRERGATFLNAQMKAAMLAEPGQAVWAQAFKDAGLA